MKRALVLAVLLLATSCAAHGPALQYPCDSPDPPPPGHVRLDGPCAWQAHSESLVVVDGTVAGRYWEMREGRIQVRPEEIVGVEVMKAALAVQRYGPDAARGVLLVRTRNAHRAEGRRLTLTGVIRQEASGAPMEGVAVHVEGSTQGVLTDSLGVYKLHDLQADAHRILRVRAARVGYIPEIREVWLRPEEDVICGGPCPHPAERTDTLHFYMRRAWHP